MDFPLVSIVMPSFNQDVFLDAAIDSVLNQNYPNLELIVADGASSDNSVALIKRRQQQDQRIRWFSRKDRGPAHAINDAMAMVRGTTIGWLNSDDLFSADAISYAVNALSAHPDWLMVYGHGQHVDANAQFLSDYPTLPPTSGAARFQQGCFICQPTLFMRRTARLLLGPLDETLRASFDFEYWLRAFAAFPDRIGFIERVQAYSRLHADCITMRLRRIIALEGMKVLARYQGYASPEWLLSYVKETLLETDVNTDWGKLTQDFTQSVVEASNWMTMHDKVQLEKNIALQLKHRRAALGER